MVTIRLSPGNLKWSKTGAPGAKANESMATEDEDSSKRKNKLRDKTAGKNERVQAIGNTVV